MEQSNSGMLGHGMPKVTNSTKISKTKMKSVDVTRFKKSDIDELFNLVKTEKGIIICVGKYKISSKTFNTFEQADKYIEEKPYEILINVSILISNISYEKTEENGKSAKNADSNI